MNCLLACIRDVDGLGHWADELLVWLLSSDSNNLSHLEGPVSPLIDRVGGLVVWLLVLEALTTGVTGRTL